MYSIRAWLKEEDVVNGVPVILNENLDIERGLFLTSRYVKNKSAFRAELFEKLGNGKELILCKHESKDMEVVR